MKIAILTKSKTGGRELFYVNTMEEVRTTLQRKLEDKIEAAAWLPSGEMVGRVDLQNNKVISKH